MSILLHPHLIINLIISLTQVYIVSWFIKLGVKIFSVSHKEVQAGFLERNIDVDNVNLFTLEHARENSVIRVQI